MLTVTMAAKGKLKEALEKQTTDPEIAVRIVSSSSDPKRLEMVLDKEKEGDQIVESEEGATVLLIGSDLVSDLEGMVVDYQETSEGIGFTISRPAPVV